MKTLDIALKDLLRSIRSASFIAFGFVVPLLVSGIFYFAFAGLASSDRGFDVPLTRVQVVNLDAGDPQAGSFVAGRVLVELLKSESLSNLLQVHDAADPAAARSAVDRQEAAVAVIIPANFTAAVFQANGSGQAAVELYKDPTLTLGPGIVQGIVRQYLDTFTGSKITAGIVAELLASHGVTVNPATAQSLAMEYARWATAASGSADPARPRSDPLLATRAPAGGDQSPTDLRTSILSMIMAGMMVFYVFFTGAASAQSLLEEQESGTLSRLFTTPTPHAMILGGRVLATYATLIVQVVALLVLSSLIFRINWGVPAAIALVALGVIVLAASFGLFLTSLLESSRQGGVIYGGVLTAMGMLGMMDIFASTVPNASLGAFKIMPLFVPQGWAVRGWELVLNGSRVLDVLPTVAVMLALGILFFAIGLLRFRRRFA